MNSKIITGSNVKWVSIFALALTFFMYAMAQAKDRGKKEEKIDTNTAVIKQLVKVDEKAIEFRVVQVAQIARLEETSGNMAEDVKDIKEDIKGIERDNKEMLKILVEINNK